MMSTEQVHPPVRLGVVGAGGFGRFALAALTGTPEVQVVAVYDADPDRAQAAAAGCGARCCRSYDDLLADPAVEAVYLATPPACHGQDALRALEQGKHVWVEKPLATTAAQAERIAALAAERGLRVGVDYVLRYSPIYRLAAEVSRTGLLGSLRHMSLENDAEDERLAPDHWFWDPAMSGGILVEHGVHFFDIAARLAGSAGEVVSAHAWVRPETGRPDRMLAVARYGDVPATFYHAFDKPARIERTEFRLAYDLGYVTVVGWMPLSLTLDGLVDAMGLTRLQEWAAAQALPMGAGREAAIRATLALVEPYRGADGETRGRGIARQVAWRVQFRVECLEDKAAIYTRTIQAGAADFARAVRDPGHRPEVTPVDALTSLRLALDATRAAGACTFLPTTAIR